MDMQAITDYLQTGANQFGVHFKGTVTPVATDVEPFDVTVTAVVPAATDGGSTAADTAPTAASTDGSDVAA